MKSLVILITISLLGWGGARLALDLAGCSLSAAARQGASLALFAPSPDPSPVVRAQPAAFQAADFRQLRKLAGEWLRRNFAALDAEAVLDTLDLAARLDYQYSNLSQNAYIDVYALDLFLNGETRRLVLRKKEDGLALQS